MDKLNDLFTKIITKLNKKVDSVEGKQLSSEDFTSGEKTKLQGIADEAQVNTIETISVNGTNVGPDEAKNVDIKAYNEDNKPEVGGRNYFGFNKGLYYDSEISFDKSINGVQIATKTDKTTYRIYALGFNGIISDFTASFWAKADSEISAVIDINDSVERNIEISTDYSKYILYFDKALSGSAYDSGFMDFLFTGSINTTVYIKDLKIERGEIATDWTPAPEDLEPTPENFQGILPIEKGGTNNSLYSSSEPFSADNFRQQWNQEQSSNFISPARHDIGNNYWSGYCSGIKFGTLDTHGYISVGYTSPEVIVGGGSNKKIIWRKQIAFKDDVSATQLALASLYESRSVSAASSDMPTESPSIDGELSSLDQNMVKIYADLCLNPDGGKTVDDVPEHLRAYVSQIVEQTLTERKEAEERYKAEMKKREEEERRKAEEEKAKAEVETEKKFETNLVIGNEDEPSSETEDEPLTE